MALTAFQPVGTRGRNEGTPHFEAQQSTRIRSVHEQEKALVINGFKDILGFNIDAFQFMRN